MNTRAEFDVGPLSWVKGEIDLAIERALQALAACAADPADSEPLKSSRAFLHQAHGALQIVGLDGVTRLSEEIEGLLGDLQSEARLRTAEAFAAAQRALRGVLAYLDQLIAGAAHQPLKLLALYRELAAARGKPPPDPVDLYFPDLSARPPRREAPPVALRAEEAGSYLRGQRARYQRGLLAWLKNDPQGASEMRAAVAAIEATLGATSQRAFWWAALAFFDALAERALPAELDARHLCNRIEQQIRRMAEGSPSVAERLMREVLYFVAQAAPATEQIRAVQEHYRLAQTIPAAEEAPLRPLESQELRAAREAHEQAKDAWGKFAAGTAQALPAFGDACAALLAACERLGNADCAALARGIAAVAERLGAHRDAMSEALGLEVATALLLLENGLAQIARPSPDFSAHAQLVCARLASCAEGTLIRTALDVPLLDEMSRKAQERLLMNQLVAEIKANLLAVERVLDAFFRDPSRREGLAGLDVPIRQVLGALEMLGEQRACDALGAAAQEIRRFAEARYQPDPRDFERLAQTLSGLGFYVEALAHGKADFDAAMRPVGSAVSETLETSQPVASVETQVAERRREAGELYLKHRERPDEAALAAALREQLGALAKDAELLAERELEEATRAALAAFDAGDEAALAEALGRIAPQTRSAAAPSPQVPIAPASAEAVDAELLGVYLEESDEVLATIRAQLEALRAHPADKEALTTVRRAFHTLKGSGRMVGLTHLGEAAWAVEQTLNLWLHEQRPASPDLLRLIAAALDYFAANVARLRAGGASSDERAIADLAERVRSGAPLPAEVPAAEPSSSAPAPEEATVEFGGERISSTLFALFSGEARAHLAAIRSEHETLRQHGVVSDELLRAVHTLAGIAGTVKIEALRDLGYALERLLQKLASSELSEEEQALVGEAIDALEAMVQQAVELRMPAAMPVLLERLDRLAAPAAEATTPAPSAEAAPPAQAPRSAEAVPPAAAALAPAERRQRRVDDDIDPQLLPVFMDEAHELVPAVGAALRDWREHPGNRALGQGLQRLLHTLKGSARMAGAMALGELTHHMETRIENALSLASLPAMLFEELENSYDRMNVLFERLQKKGVSAAPAMPAAPTAPVPAPEAAPRGPAAVAAAAMLRVRAEVVDRLVNEAGEVAIARSRIETEMRALRAAMQELTENVARLRGQLREIEIQAESQMQSRLEVARESQREFDPLEFDRFTRFQELTRLMAESVNDVQTVHQNLINAVDETERALTAQARLNRDLQQDLMRVRMVPFGSLSERLYRVARQTAKELGKRANLDIRGAQVELDRSVLERITAPIEHLLRNAITHGIEPPEARRAAGKPEIGEIRLELAQEGNEIRIAISDDGAGLDIERIRDKAIALGLMGPRVALSEAEIADFIFQPGFTTATEVSQVAGRGVGMDVVKNEVAALGGRVEMRFKRGEGTRFTIYLPLTLAVTQAVLVRAAGRIHAVPAVMVEQVLQYRADQIEVAWREREARWQERRYPFHYLPHLLGSAAVPEQRRFSPVLFLRSGANAIAMQVDEMIGASQEIVVKAIGPQLQRIAGITGATVLGSGEIVLILNPVQLALREVAATAPALAAPKPAAPAATQPTVMVVDDSLTVRKVTGRLLERQGYTVVTARDGVEAMEKLQELVPDAMLVDIEMPRMDGFDLTRNVRADPRLAHVPIVMITSRTAEKHQNYAREVGVNVFLGKPYQEEELLRHIAGFLQERRAAA